MTINLLHFSFRKPYYIYVITIFRFCIKNMEISDVTI